MIQPSSPSALHCHQDLSESTRIDAPSKLEHQLSEIPAMSPTTAEPDTESPLLKLPAELRNRIYELAIEGKPRIASLRARKISDLKHANEHAVHTLRFTAEYGTSEPALLSVCRATRREAMGMFLASHPCKVVLFAYGRDGAEMAYWQNRLSCLFSGSGSMAEVFSMETNPPNLATWAGAIRWLRDSQTELVHGEFVGTMWKDFESETIDIQCAIAELARDPRRKPWDLVGNASAYLNLLIYGVQLPTKKVHWKETWQR